MTEIPYGSRSDVQLRHLVERLVREGRSEREIEAAVRRAAPSPRRSVPRRPRRSRLTSLVRGR
jgi:hypothetical protein